MLYCYIGHRTSSRKLIKYVLNECCSFLRMNIARIPEYGVSPSRSNYVRGYIFVINKLLVNKHPTSLPLWLRRMTHKLAAIFVCQPNGENSNGLCGLELCSLCSYLMAFKYNEFSLTKFRGPRLHVNKLSDISGESKIEFRRVDHYQC